MDDEIAAGGRRGAGGTEGGVMTFFLGVAMAAAGGYLLTSRVVVQTGVWQWWGFSGFGLSLIPLLFGVGMLFFDGRSLLGKLLTFVGVVIIFAGILLNLNIYFQQTPLFATLMMLVLLVGGIGLILRSLRPIR
jgi:predicted membrane channel-forming protein YqfA (hemolysin III family)